MSKVKPILYMLGKGGISVLQTSIFTLQEGAKNKRKVVSDMEVIHKLLKEEFFRDTKGLGGGVSPSFESILQRLLTMLDTDDAEVHSKVCEYILDLHR